MARPNWVRWLRSTPAFAGQALVQHQARDRRALAAA